MNSPTVDPNDHIVSDGRVHCQKAGRDVSVEVCWMCEQLVGFDVEGKIEVVRCAPGRMLAELLPSLP